MKGVNKNIKIVKNIIISISLLLETCDVIIEDLVALPLCPELRRQELELLDHVGEAGGQLLAQEEEGLVRVGVLAVVQQVLQRDRGRGVPF